MFVGGNMCIEKEIVEKLRELGKTMTTVESCTGGMIAAAITSVSGSSAVFQQGYVTYCDQAKHKLVGVKKKTLKKHTAVSEQVAAQMALGGAKEAKADCCVSVTGYAGPPSGNGEEVGLVYIGCCVKKKVKVKELHLEGNREEIRNQAREEALRFLKMEINKKWK